jgi:metal-responsive CopG/Arc/MetJ family transcriptional regulator
MDCGQGDAMESVETVSVSLPAELLAHMREFADRDQHTLDEVITEALRQYEKKRWWDEMNRNKPVISHI